MAGWDSRPAGGARRRHMGWRRVRISPALDEKEEPCESTVLLFVYRL